MTMFSANTSVRPFQRGDMGGKGKRFGEKRIVNNGRIKEKKKD